MALSLFLRISLFAALLVVATGDSEPVVETTHGSVQGERYVSDDGFAANVFRGIPYAAPPLRALRFKKPQPVTAWKGVKKTNSWPSRCIQNLVFGQILPEMDNDSEDCLYLNVFAPSESAAIRFPVFFWVHGGGYFAGSTVEFGMEGIVRHLVQKGVVVVNFQYRLGPWGFLATGDDAARGNWALWDAVAALQWVHDNVDRFGGDPSRVTVAGESAGAATTAFLSMTAEARDLYQQNIIMSGNARLWWTRPAESSITYSYKLAEALACDLPSHVQMVDCLRTKSTDEIAATTKNMAVDKSDLLPFLPIEDGDFFPETVDELIRAVQPKPTMIGSTQLEFANLVLPPSESFDINYSAGTAFGYNDFKAYLNVLLPDSKYRNASVLRRLALHHYLHSQGDKHNSTFLVDQYIALMNDFVIFATTHEEAVQRLKNGANVWLYSFDHFNEDAFAPDHRLKGAYHMVDLEYIFGIQPYSPYILREHHLNEDDERVIDLFTTLITNFVKDGDPSSAGEVTWLPITTEAPARYLSITAEPQMKSSYHRPGVAFWNGLIKDLAATGVDDNAKRRDEL